MRRFLTALALSFCLLIGASPSALAEDATPTTAKTATAVKGAVSTPSSATKSATPTPASLPTPWSTQLPFVWPDTQPDTWPTTWKVLPAQTVVIPDSSGSGSVVMETETVTQVLKAAAEYAAQSNPEYAQLVQAEVAKGNQINVELVVKDVPQSEIADAALLFAAAQDGTLTNVSFTYKSIGIDVRANSKVLYDVTQTPYPILFSFPLPGDSLPGVQVVRAHDGEVEVLPSYVQDGAVYFISDQFSTFAIATGDAVSQSEIAQILLPEQPTAISAQGDEQPESDDGSSAREQEQAEKDAAAALEILIKEKLGSSGTSSSAGSGVLSLPTATPGPSGLPVGTPAPPEHVQSYEGTIPMTADAFPLARVVAVLVASVAAICVLIIVCKERKNRPKK